MPLGTHRKAAGAGEAASVAEATSASKSTMRSARQRLLVRFPQRRADAPLNDYKNDEKKKVEDFRHAAVSVPISLNHPCIGKNRERGHGGCFRT